MSHGNTAWILVSTAMVLLMTPGLALFYGGLVRERQVLNTMKMSFVALGVIALQWVVIGYSLVFAPGSSLIGGLEWAGLAGVTGDVNADYADSIPHLAFMAFQMMFAIITPALISGAVVGRMKFKAYLLFILFWALLVYNPIAHWVWGPGGWIGELGALDFAGGTVVHISAGVSALVAALMLGPGHRKGDIDMPHNVPLVVLGASLLWFGWFGFNAGSALAADGLASVAFVTTMTAAAAAVVTWVLTDMLRKGKPTATGSAIAAVVGLVAITPAAGFVSPMAAITIGAIAALVSYAAMAWLRRTALDDTLDVFACHGIGGAVGSLATGVFASLAVNPGGADGLLSGNVELVGVQFISVVATAAYAAFGTWFLLVIIRALVGLRTSDEGQEHGIDVTEHAEYAYNRETLLGLANAESGRGRARTASEKLGYEH